MFLVNSLAKFGQVIIRLQQIVRLVLLSRGSLFYHKIHPSKYHDDSFPVVAAWPPLQASPARPAWTPAALIQSLFSMLPVNKSF